MAVFYRKYRPQKISDLDLVDVRERLEKDLEKGELPHAYLFVGPRGSGKTSAARILSKVLNCKENQDSKGKLEEPCLECDQCENIEKNKAVDVIEIDAASHRGIDAIRDLRDKIGLSPVSAEKKVYIIDEVHMLTTPAFNALLKTLEEPPEHAQFFLCTTEEEKVPETIASRCVRVGFTKATVEEVRDSLEKVVEGEDLKMSDEALDLLADSVDGSFREGHKLLEQLSGKEEIELADVKKVLGVAQGIEPERLAKLLLDGDAKGALKELDEADKAGVVWSGYSLSVLGYLRDQLKAKYGLGKEEVKHNKERVKMVTERVARACVEMKNAVVEPLPLEVAAAELGEEQSDQGESKKGNGVKKKKPNSSSKAKKAKKKSTQKEKVKVKAKKKKSKSGAKISLQDIKDKWDELIKRLAPDNHSVAGLLRSCEPKSVDDDFLVIEAYYKFHKEQLEQSNRRIMVEREVDELMGVGGVKYKLGKKPKKNKVVKEKPVSDNAKSGEDVELADAVEELFGV